MRYGLIPKSLLIKSVLGYIRVSLLLLIRVQNNIYILHIIYIVGTYSNAKGKVVRIAQRGEYPLYIVFTRR